VLVDLALPAREVELGQGRVVRAARGHHDVVDRRRQVAEELHEAVRVGGVEGRAPDRADLPRGVLEALLIAAGEDDLRPFGACQPGGLEADPGAAADGDDGLPDQCRLALDRIGGRCGAHRSSNAASRAAAISPWRVFSAAT
jgi:hypothetical protein